MSTRTTTSTAPEVAPLAGERARPGRALPWALAALFAVLYAVLGAMRYRGFAWSSWDLAIFTEAVDHYAHLQAPIAEVKGAGFNVLGDHFSPILAVLAPFYRLVPSPVTLLVAQAVLLGISLVPVVRVARRLLGAPAALALGLAYGASFGLVDAVVVDFHEVAFAVPLVALALEALLEERWRAVVAWSVPLVLVKEDLGVTVAVIGLLVAWRGPRRLGLGLAAFGAVASALETLVLVPLASSGRHYAYFAQLHGDAGSGVSARLHTTWMLVALTIGAALASRLVLAVVPTLAWRFASQNPAYWGTDWHYDAVLMPVVFLAAIDTTARWRASPHRPLRWYAAVIPLGSLLAACLWLPTSPLRQLSERSSWTDTPQRTALRHALALVPRGVTVQSDLALLSHLAGRDAAFWIGSPAPAPDYVVIDEATGWGPPAPRKLPGYLTQLHPGARYRLIWTGDGVSVLRRVTHGTGGFVE